MRRRAQQAQRAQRAQQARQQQARQQQRPAQPQGWACNTAACGATAAAARRSERWMRQGTSAPRHAAGRGWAAMCRRAQANAGCLLVHLMLMLAELRLEWLE